MRRSRTLLLLTISLVAVLALAACSSDSNDSSSSSSTTKATTAAGSGTTTKPAAVSAADNTKLGTIVVDEQGRTVYTLTDAAGKAVACEGGCLGAWPPVLIVAPATATGSGGVKDVGSVAVSDGDQVTVNGLPVYTFSGDPGPGDANGDGLVSFGGTWNVVKVSGGATGTGTTETTKPTTSTTSDYGY